MEFQVVFILAVIIVSVSSMSLYQPINFPNDVEAYQTELDFSRYESVPIHMDEYTLADESDTKNEFFESVQKTIEGLVESNAELKKKLEQTQNELAQQSRDFRRDGNKQKVANVQLEAGLQENTDVGFWDWISIIAKRLLGGFLGWFGIKF